MSINEQQEEHFFDPKMTDRQKMTKRFLGMGFLSLLAVGLFFGWKVVLAEKGNSQQLTSEKSPLPVKALELSRVDFFEVQRTFTGVIKPARVSDLSFKRTDKIISVAVEEGDRVTEKQLLAVLDQRKLLSRELELIARKKAAVAMLNELTNGAREQTIAVARAEKDQMQAELSLKQAELKRVKDLFEDEVISRSEYDSAQFAAQVAEARFEAADQKLIELIAGTRQEKIDAQQAVVDQLEAACQEVKVDLEDSSLKAPFAGIIAKRFFDEGTIVSPGTALLRIVDDSNLEAWIGLPARTASRMLVGQTHQLTVENRVVSANVSAILPQLDTQTRTQTVIFKLKKNELSRFTPLQIVRVEIPQQNQSEGYWVPVSALVESMRGLWALYLVEKIEKDSDSLVVVRRDVEVLHLQGDRAFVRGMIQPGEQIITDGTHRVVPKQKVKISHQESF